MPISKGIFIMYQNNRILQDIRFGAYLVTKIIGTIRKGRKGNGFTHEELDGYPQISPFWHPSHIPHNSTSDPKGT